MYIYIIELQCVDDIYFSSTESSVTKLSKSCKQGAFGKKEKYLH